MKLNYTLAVNLPDDLRVKQCWRAAGGLEEGQDAGTASGEDVVCHAGKVGNYSNVYWGK